MKTITGVIIAKNDEKMIAKALESLEFCNEIIVINNDSKDRTKQVAEGFKAKVYDITSGDFSELRNFGLSKVTTDYVLYIDTDERVSRELKESILEVLKSEEIYVAYKIQRKNFYFGNYEWPYIEKLERFFKKDKLVTWKGKLHESPVIDGKVGELKGFLTHFTHRDLESMVNKTMEWSDKEALLRYNTHHPQMSWWRFPRVMLTAFLNSYIKQKGFKAGTAGFVESIYQSFSMFITYAKLWELQKISKKS